MNGDKLYLKHIWDSIIRIEKFTGEVSFEDFMSDEMRQSAVVRETEIIGEAVKNLSKNFKKRHAKVPWQEAINMRNKLIHEYFGVDLEIVWETINEDLPKLKKLLVVLRKGK